MNIGGYKIVVKVFQSISKWDKRRSMVVIVAAVD